MYFKFYSRKLVFYVKFIETIVKKKSLSDQKDYLYQSSLNHIRSVIVLISVKTNIKK